jgi:uncharacterized protein (TIGR01777 family)
MKRIVLSGGTGLIGSALCKELSEGDYRVTVVTRSPESAQQRLAGLAIDCVAWGTEHQTTLPDVMEGASAVINLAGESIAGIWTTRKQRAILESRMRSGHTIAAAMVNAARKPALLIQASAVGYYGNRGDESLDDSATRGSGFLADVVRRWEESTLSVENAGVRRVIIRTGLVLDAKGGFLPRFSIPFWLFAGGPVGSGNQWMPWIHLTDEVRAIRFLLENEQLCGIFNFASPNPVTNREFGQTLGRVMRRPFWLRVPGLVLKTFLGRMADELLLSGQRAIPERLVAAGFEFTYPHLEPALRDVLGCGVTA